MPPSATDLEPRLVPQHLPRTALDATVAQLRAWILDGTLAANERLQQDRLATALGISRMPIREALRQLASEGLVRIVPHRGAYVASLDPAEIRELYLVRAALERLASGLAVGHVSDNDLARLNTILVQMVDLIDTTDDELAIELDRQFHDTIYDAANSPYLHDLIRQARHRSQAFRRAHIHMPGRMRISLDEHTALLQALSDRDQERFEHLSHAHLINAGELLITYLEQERRANERTPKSPSI